MGGPSCAAGSLAGVGVVRNIKIPTSREQTITEALFAMAELDDDQMLFNAGFEQWRNKFKELLGFYDNIDRTILRRINDEFGIPLDKRTEDGLNYILKVRRPGGNSIDVLVPVED